MERSACEKEGRSASGVERCVDFSYEWVSERVGKVTVEV